MVILFMMNNIIIWKDILNVTILNLTETLGNYFTCIHKIVRKII